MKRQAQLILSIIFVMSLGFTCHGQQVGDAFTSGNITYRITSLSPKTVEVTGRASSSTDTDIIIPERVFYGQYYTVTSIRYDAFRNKALTSVGIGENVTSIGLNAFRNNLLTGVAIPDAVTVINTFAFAENQLGSITLGSNVEHIGYGTFRDNQLTEVVIPNGVPMIIKEQAFAHNSINKVTVERNSPPTLHEYAFLNTGRYQIDLLVPKGKIQDYESAGWTGFNSITEEVGEGDR